MDYVLGTSQGVPYDLKTCRTEFGQQMRSRELSTYVPLNRLLMAYYLSLFCSNMAHFSEIELVCDGPTDGRTDGRTYPLIEMRERI